MGPSLPQIRSRQIRSFPMRSVPQSLFFYGASLLLGAVGALVPSGEAAACSLAPSGSFVSMADSIPVDGTLLVSFTCYSGCPSTTDPLALVVTSSDGTLVPGTIVENELTDGVGWIVWKADAQLTLDETYRVVVDSEDLAGGDPEHLFQAVAAATTTTAEISVERNDSSHLEFSGESVCCEEGFVDSCGGGGCSLVDAKATPFVDIILDWSTPDAVYQDQFLFQARMFNEKIDEVTAWQQGPSLYLRYEPASEYCYELVARHVPSGDETPVASDCVKGSSIELPDLEAALADNKQHLFATCTIPPAGYEDAWCATFKEAIASGSCDKINTEPCEAALAACPAPADETHSDDKETRNPDDELPAGQSEEEATAPGGGCSVGGPARSTPWSLVAFTGALWLLNRRRRLSPIEVQ